MGSPLYTHQASHANAGKECVHLVQIRSQESLLWFSEEDGSRPIWLSHHLGGIAPRKLMLVFQPVGRRIVNEMICEFRVGPLFNPLIGLAVVPIWPAFVMQRARQSKGGYMCRIALQFVFRRNPGATRSECLA